MSTQEEDEFPPIFVSFNGYCMSITCYSIISSAYFIKETINDFDKIDFIVLKSDVVLSSDAKIVMEQLLSCSVEDLLTKTIVNETDTEIDVSYNFNEHGIEYLDINLNTDQLIDELLLLLDCLDITAILMAFAKYLVDHKGKTFEDIINNVRNRRYITPTMFVRKLGDQ